MLWIDQHMADGGRLSVVVSEYRAVNNDAAVHAVAALQVDDVVETGPGASFSLGDGGQLGPTTDNDRSSKQASQVGPDGHGFGVERGSRSYARGARCGGLLYLLAEFRKDVTHVLAGGARGRVGFAAVQQLPAEADSGGYRPVCSDVEGQDVGALRSRADDQRWAPGP
ncbi:hypothetical protein GCM10010399_54590 [Dactylosporangium fulvum]